VQNSGKSLTRFEILASFVQVFATIMMLQAVPWPTYWNIWAQYLAPIFTEFDFSFGTFFTIPFKPVCCCVSFLHRLIDFVQFFMFFGWMLVPAFFLGVFAKKWKREEWEYSYVTKYRRTAGVATLLYIIAIIVSVGCGFLVDYAANVALYVC